MKDGVQDRRQPRQDRSRATVAAILEAAAQVLAARGPARTTTNHIAERAGVSVGSVYQYFPNKRALYDALGRAYVDKLRAALADTWPTVVAAPAEEILPHMFAGLLQVSVEDPILSGMLHLTAIPPRAFDLIAAFERELERHVAALLASRPDLRARCRTSPELTARVLVRAAGGVVGRTLAAEPELLRTAAFRDELAQLIVGYLSPPAKT